MSSPRYHLALLAIAHLVACSHAGPLGPLTNVTSADMGLKEGSCAVGDVVYLPGDEFPGSSACERCTCSEGGVQCTQQQCEPRPGCKALHRPDQCCPTYQCECEQKGRVYGNGEKLVDPADPCLVCYCQGGEVVCRRIACFVRDDCKPRLVPGRCCPEYDNCPLRGVTALPGMTPSSPVSTAELLESSAVQPTKKEVQKITIKEITPVSEIPIITDVKIKEILPSPSIEVAEYSSSKSPLIPREATSEKSTKVEPEPTKPEPEVPSVIEILPSETASPEVIKTTTGSQAVDDEPPSKISLSTQDSINSDIYPSVPIVATMGSPASSSEAQIVTSTTKAPMIEEEDPSLFDHNPAFPPLPDDLSVLSNHGDEIVPEPSADTDHVPMDHTSAPEVVVTSAAPSTVLEDKDMWVTTHKYNIELSSAPAEEFVKTTFESSTVRPETTTNNIASPKEVPVINLRSAIPTELLNTSPESISTDNQNVALKTSAQTTIEPTFIETTTVGKIMDSVDSKDTYTTTQSPLEIMTTTEKPIEIASTGTSLTQQEQTTSSTIKSFVTSTEATTQTELSSLAVETSDQNPHDASEKSLKESTELLTNEPLLIETTTESNRSMDTSPASSEDTTRSPPEVMTTTEKPIEISSTATSFTTAQEQTTSSIAKSHVPTEVTSQTELSSLPIETSDQNPHDASEKSLKEFIEVSTMDPLTTIDRTSSEIITVSKSSENGQIDNVETTEFVLTPFGSSESATDVVELIKIAGDSTEAESHAQIIDGTDQNKFALRDFIKLVSDVASISDKQTTDSTTTTRLVTAGISDSEELIPINAGYKSKSNYNQNSITEVPVKSKSASPANKQRVVEIEDDESTITDSPSPNDKVEPTTRRPIIDNVSDDKMPDAKTDKKDIEIITQSYVPTLNKRPTKVVLKEDKSVELPLEDAPASSVSLEVTTGSAEAVTDSSEREEPAAPAPDQ